MNIQNKYQKFKERIYLNKINKLLKCYDFYSSISKKTKQLFNDSFLEELTRIDNKFDLELSRNIIQEFIEYSLFNLISKEESKLSKEIINFILFYRIDQILMDNIDIFKEDIEFLNRYNNLKSMIICYSSVRKVYM